MERNNAIDFIKFFAIFSVVVIHVFPRDSQIGLFILDNVSRFAVPFFFTASGYLFGRKMIHTRDSIDYFKRYIIKILKLYLCWLFFYMMYDVLILYKVATDAPKEFKQYINHFSFLDVIYYGTGTSGYQLWFLTALIWSVIFLFVFLKLKKVKLLLIISLILNLLGLFGQSYSMFYEFPLSTRDALFIGLFYSTLGFFFAYDKFFEKSKSITNKTYLLLIFIFFTVQVAEGYLLEKVLSGSHGEYFISTIFLTAFLFLFALNNKTLGMGLFITKVGGRALGIYIVHVVFINIFDLILSAAKLEHISDNLFLKLFETFLIISMSYISYDLLQYFKRRLSRLIKTS
ncbi:acyltransferase family protein [Peribacillus simplex]|uniref:acyltransferase family protein n=1 Tax=Peribacillus simplex TaxID=1478 RepID=UPI0024C10911|nr:acyltransferase [Peribacillus simplex]WHZ00083.1 acyltransferase [Peribacillus simplex]